MSLAPLSLILPILMVYSDSLASIKITSLETVGSLKLNGVDVTLNQSISKADIDSGKLIFIPVSNQIASPYDSFSFKVNDGVLDSSASYTMTINVIAVNDAPVLSSNASWQAMGADIDGSAANDFNGSAVAMSGNGLRMAVGAMFNDNNGTDSGNVKVYDWNGSGWVQLGSDIRGETAGDRSGGAISLNKEGTRLAIAASGNDGNGADSGHVRIYDWNGSTWVQIGSDINGEAAGDLSGVSVSLSDDGTRLAIGAHSNNGNGDSSGHVRVYTYNGSGWVQLGSDINGEAAFDNSGRSVSMSGDGMRLAIGAPNNDGNGSNSGHVRIYAWKDNTWQQLGHDIDGAASGDNFGVSVSLNANGTRLAIGAYLNDGNGSNSGQVRIYAWNGSDWAQIGNDIYGSATGDQNGFSVALSDDGLRVFIGSIGSDSAGADSGQVRAYTYNGIAWVALSAAINGEAAGDQSGFSIAINSDGTRLIIGATNNDGNGSNSGQVRVYGLVAPTVNYSENDPVKVINSTLSVSDIDSTHLESATISITENYVASEDVLVFINTSNITGSFNSATGVLTLSGHDTVANYQSALRSVGYRNTSDNPSTAIRTIKWVVNDGELNSAVLFDTMSVTKINDPPMINVAASTSYTENMGAKFIDSNLTLTDVDDLNLVNSVTVRISGNYVQGQDLLAFTKPANTNINGSFNAVSGTLTLQGSDTMANYQMALRSVTYQNTSNIPSTLSRTISWVLSDGTSSSSATSTINVLEVNEIPGLVVTGAAWIQLGQDINGEAAIDLSGSSTSMSADGMRLAIGAPNNDGGGSNTGHVRVYQWNASTKLWEKLGQDIDGTAANDFSGSAVSLSGDGTTLAIGTPKSDANGNSDSGRVKIYRYNGSLWVQMGVGIDGLTAGEQNGSSVAMNSDGTRIIIGTPFNSSNGFLSGYARVFEWNGSTWIQLGLPMKGEASFDFSGMAVAISANGSQVAIGAPNNDGNGSDSGHVRVYEYVNGNWQQLGSDINGEAAGDGSGRTLALSANGLRLSIGASGNDGNGDSSGHVRIYEYSGGSWQKLGGDIDGEVTGDQAGASVVLSADGMQVAIGANTNDANGSNSGTVMVFRWQNGAWTKLGSNINGEAAGDLSGGSVAMSADGSRVIIGAANNDGNGSDSGHVRVYTLDAGTMVYNENDPATIINNTITLTDTDDTRLERATVTIIGNYTSNQDVLVFTNTANITGSFNINTGILTLTGSGTLANYQSALRSVSYKNTSYNPNTLVRTISWVVNDGSDNSVAVTSKIEVVAVNDAPSLAVEKFWTQLGADIDGEATGDHSGWSTSISADGTRIAVSATGNDGNGVNSGHVRVYVFNGVSWTQLGQDIDGEAAGDFSGNSVSLSGDGSTLAIGATDNNNQRGQVRIYRYNGSAWVQIGSDIDGESSGEQNGRSVALNHDGTRLVIGALFNSSNGFLSGYVRIFEWSGSAWGQLGQSIKGEASFDFSGASVSISADGSIVAIGAFANDGNGNDSGHVRVYQYNGTAWVKLGQDIDGEAATDNSGFAVVLSADGFHVAIGAFGNDGSGADSGHVRVYNYNGSAWVQMGSDIDGEAAGDQSGYSVAMSADGMRIIIGAISNDSSGNNSGHVRIYDYKGSNWLQLGNTIKGETSSDQSGWSVAMSADGSKVVIGAPFNDGSGADSGHTRVYFLDNKSITYRENDPATVINNTIVISDVDNTHIQSATVSISANYNITQDILAFVNTTNITGSFNASTGVLTLTGLDTLSAYQSALRSVTYRNTSDNPNTAVRTVSWVINDGQVNSTVVNSAIYITPVNDAPTAANKTVTTNEDTLYTFLASDFNFTDIDGNTLASVKVTTLATLGSLKLNNVDVSLNQVISKADIDAGLLKFTPVANANGTSYASFSFKVNDGAVDSTSAYTMTINVNPVNDAPTAANKTVTTNEDTDYLFKSSDFNFADVDGDSLSSVKITTSATVGNLKLNGINVTANQVISKASIDAGLLKFTPMANANGMSYANFGFKVTDGAVDSVAAYTMMINVTAVNDAPIAANRTVTTAEDTTYVFAASDFNFNDVDGDLFASVKITSVVNSGSLKLNGVDVGLNQVIMRTDIDAGKLSFTPVANANGLAYDSFSFKVNDGVLDSVSSYTMTMKIDPINDAPTAENNSISINEDTTHTFTLGNFKFSDIDSDSLVSVKITSLESIGSLKLDGVDITLNQVISAADIAANKLTFIPVANGNGNNYDSFSFKVNDGTVDSVASYTMTINIIAINDAPVISAISTLDYTENDGAVIIDNAISLSDVDDTLLESATISIITNYQGGEDVLGFVDTANIKGVFNATTGVLKLTGIDTVAAYQTALRSIRYENTSDNPSLATRTLSWLVNDGEVNSVVTNSTISITSMNDAPTAVNNTLTINEDTPYTFTVADFNFSDIDGDNLASIKITTLENAGSLQLNNSDVTLNQVILRADITAGNLKFIPVSNTNGANYASFGFSVNDSQIDSESYTMSINVNEINDAPTAANHTITLDEDETHIFSHTTGHLNILASLSR